MFPKLLELAFSVGLSHVISEMAVDKRKLPHSIYKEIEPGVEGLKKLNSKLKNIDLSKPQTVSTVILENISELFAPPDVPKKEYFSGTDFINNDPELRRMSFRKRDPGSLEGSILFTYYNMLRHTKDLEVVWERRPEPSENSKNKEQIEKMLMEEIKKIPVGEINGRSYYFLVHIDYTKHVQGEESVWHPCGSNFDEIEDEWEEWKVDHPDEWPPPFFISWREEFTKLLADRIWESFNNYIFISPNIHEGKMSGVYLYGEEWVNQGDPVNYEGELLDDMMDMFDKYDKANTRYVTMFLGKPGGGKSVLVKTISRKCRDEGKRVLAIDNTVFGPEVKRIDFKHIIELFNPYLVWSDDVHHYAKHLGNKLDYFDTAYYDVPKTILTANRINEIVEEWLRIGRLDQIQTFDIAVEKDKKNLISSIAKSVGLENRIYDYDDVLFQFFQKASSAYIVGLFTRVKVFGWNYKIPDWDYTFHELLGNNEELINGWNAIAETLNEDGTKKRMEEENEEESNQLAESNKLDLCRGVVGGFPY